MSISTTKKKVTYHVLKFEKKNLPSVPYNSFNFEDFISWFRDIDPEKRLLELSKTKFTSLDILELIPDKYYQGYSRVVFGMMSTGNNGSRRNLKDSRKNTKRENPKKIEEGEELENFFILAFKSNSIIELVFQNAANGIKSHNLKNYLEKFIIKYLNAKNQDVEFRLIEGNIIEDEQIMLDRLDRVTKTKIYIDKSILENELGLSDRILQVKEDLVLTVSAERRKDLIEFLKDLKHKLQYTNKIDRVWVEGKDSNGNVSSFFLDEISKRTFVTFETNPATAEIIPESAKNQLLLLI